MDHIYFELQTTESRDFNSWSGSGTEYIEPGSGELIEGENVLEFRLIYQGALHSNARPAEKHRIRRYLHPQLRRLWRLHKGLRQLANRFATTAEPAAMEDERVESGLAAIGRKWNRAGFDLVPLVTPAHALRCSVDVLFLRPEEDRFVMCSGDIDGRLKTLFDALRIPLNRDEAANAEPGDDERPLFCLLEDDRLITEVRVFTDQLLLLPGERDVNANDTFAVIHIKLNHKTGGTLDRWFD